MSALIIAPNMGLALRGGGGVKVALAQAEALLEQGLKVVLIALTGFSLKDLVTVHGVNIDNYKNKIKLKYMLGNMLNDKEECIMFKPCNKKQQELREKITRLTQLMLPLQLPWLLSSIYIRNQLTKDNPDIVIFNDDVPKTYKAKYCNNSSKAVLFSNFPYAAKIAFSIEEEVGSAMTSFFRTYVERRMLRGVSRFLMYVETPPPMNIFIANSSVTAMFMRKLWGVKPHIVYPPVDLADMAITFLKNKDILNNIVEEKENITISLGAIQPNKRYEALIEAISLLRADLKLFIIGHMVNEKYYLKLEKMIKDMNLEKKVKILTDVPRHYLIKYLKKAKIIVHTSHFEPFGIAVVEGMSMGCVPIVYSGRFSGPWIDIVDKGRYGLGFKTVEELADNIEKVLTDDKLFSILSKNAIERAVTFSKTAFKEKFVKVLNL